MHPCRHSGHKAVQNFHICFHIGHGSDVKWGTAKEVRLPAQGYILVHCRVPESSLRLCKMLVKCGHQPWYEGLHKHLQCFPLPHHPVWAQRGVLHNLHIFEQNRNAVWHYQPMVIRIFHRPGILIFGSKKSGPGRRRHASLPPHCERHDLKIDPDSNH